MKNHENAPKISNISKLQDELAQLNVSLIDFFQYLRLKWIKEINREDIPFIERVLSKSIKDIARLNLNENQKKELDIIIEENSYSWDDINFHLSFRITTYKDLIRIVKGIDPEIEEIIEKGYKLSIMPLALVTQNKDLLNKFIPKKDFFTEHAAKTWDPYGIFVEKAKIFRKGHYIASQKFKRIVLMNITGACPMGCVGCYKGFFTRTSGSKFYTNLEKAVSNQTKLLVEHLNEHPEIRSVIISGGEPLLLDNAGYEKILQDFKKARYLGEIRICTGVIFQGLPFRIDDEILNMLKNFEKETGIKIKFNAHLAHPEQFTPESIIAIKKITQNGFLINTQVPLQRNVNIFVDNFEKTMNLLYRLAELQGISGVRPYKYILHMNVGSLEYSVPLEFMLEVLGELKYRLDHPIPETWQPVSYCILCKQGNILLSPQLLFLLKKEIHKEKDSIVYTIPVPVQGRKFQKVNYTEPLLKGYNDNSNSLERFKPRPS